MYLLILFLNTREAGEWGNVPFSSLGDSQVTGLDSGFLPASVAAPLNHLCWLLFLTQPGRANDSAFRHLPPGMSLVVSFIPLMLNTMFMLIMLKCIMAALF